MFFIYIDEWKYNSTIHYDMKKVSLPVRIVCSHHENDELNIWNDWKRIDLPTHMRLHYYVN